MWRHQPSSEVLNMDSKYATHFGSLWNNNFEYFFENFLYVLYSELVLHPHIKSIPSLCLKTCISLSYHNFSLQVSNLSVIHSFRGCPKSGPHDVERHQLQHLFLFFLQQINLKIVNSFKNISCNCTPDRCRFFSQEMRDSAHKKIYLKSCEIDLKSDCINYFPIYL